MHAADIIDFKNMTKINTASSGGSGPEDPMLEKRVETLENDVKEVKASLSRLEIGFARIEEKLSHIATTADLTRVEGRLEAKLSQVEGQLESKIAFVEGKISQLPTTWQIIAILSGLLVGIAGLVYTTTNFLNQKPPISSTPMPQK